VKAPGSAGGREGGPERGPSTRAVHAGEAVALPSRRPTAVPIYQTAPWSFDTAGELVEAFGGPGRDALYSRYANPTVRVLEEKVAALEGAADAVAFASGMGAISTTLGTLLASGDRLLASADLYGGTDGWLRWLGERHPEVAVDREPLATLLARLEAEAETAVGDLAAVHLETPSNPLLACCDLRRAAELCRRIGERSGRRPRLVVDGTMASPAVQRPLELGADLVVHSATKFLAGHSDVTAGLVAGDAESCEAIRRSTIVGGATLDPHAAFLVARGVKTLALRLERQSANAARLAELAAGHPVVERVHYPGRDPVGRAQMRSGGAMLALSLAGGAPAAHALLDAFELVRIIPSLGGVETGAILPAATSHRNLTPDERAARGIADGLVRLSCGIEDVEDLEEDLRQALDRAAG